MSEHYQQFPLLRVEETRGNGHIVYLGNAVIGWTDDVPFDKPEQAVERVEEALAELLREKLGWLEGPLKGNRY